MGVPFMFPEFEMECDAYLNCLPPKKYQYSGTVDVGLQKKQYQIGFIRTGYFIGTMAGSMFLCWASDNYGKRRVLKYSCIAGIPILFLAAFAFNIYMITIAAFFIGIIEVGVYFTGFVLCEEIIDAECRALYSGLYYSIWSLFACFVSIMYIFKEYI